MKKFHKITCRVYATKFNLKKGQLNPHHSKNMKGKGNPRYGVVPSKETREKVRKIHKKSGKFKGKKNPMFGKTHTNEARRKISDYLKITIKGKNNPFYGKKHTEKTKRKISQIRIKLGLAKGENNPLFGRGHTKKTKEKMAEIKRELFLKYPEKHINALIAKHYKRQKNKKGGYISKKQIEIYTLLKTRFPDAQLNHPIITDNGLYFADIGIPSIRLDLEYDGRYWHQDKLKDESRDNNITKKGWEVIRIKDKDVDRYTKKELLDYVLLSIENKEKL